MNNPTVKKENGVLAVNENLQLLLTAFWVSGGQEKYETTKAARDANKIPDSQWFKANLMGLIDDAEITYEPSEVV